MSQTIRMLLNRMAGIIGLGRVTSQNDGGNVQKVQYQTPLEVASAPRLVEFGFTSALPVGTDVVLAFLGGDRSNPVIIASNHQSFRHAGLNSGETAIYNQWGLNIVLAENGIFVNAMGKDVEVNNATNVTINASESILAKTPLLKCTGDFVDNCETNTRTLKELRDAHNDHQHDVDKVQAGTDKKKTEKTGSQVNG